MMSAILKIKTAVKEYKHSLIAAMIMIAVGLVLFPSAGRDDVYLTYWPAYTLAHYGQIMNYNGIPFEQSSSLLHVLFLAGLRLLTKLDFPILGLIFSLTCFALTLLVAKALLLRAGSQVSDYAPYLAGACLFYLYWAFGALEGTMTALLILTLLLSVDKYYQSRQAKWLLASYLNLALLSLARPEMIVVLPLALLVAWVLEEFNAVRANGAFLLTSKTAQYIRLLLGSAGITGLIMIGRSLYFGKYFPQPVYAKAHLLNMDSLLRGAGYYFSNMTSFPLLALFIASVYSGYLLLRSSGNSGEAPRTSIMRYAFAFFAAYSLFILFSGGDWMEGGRFVVPIIPVMALLLCGCLDGRDRRISLVVLIVVMGLNLGAIARFVSRDTLSLPAWEYRRLPAAVLADPQYSTWEKLNYAHIRDIATIGPLKKVLAACSAVKKEKVTILSNQAGMVMYYIGRSYFGQYAFTDTHSLATDEFTKGIYQKTVKKVQTGTQIKWGEYFAKYQPPGRFVRPDIIFGVYSKNNDYRQALRENGYEIVYRVQERHLLKKKYIDQFIAVRKALLAEINTQ